MLAQILGALALAIWLFLLLAREGFWRAAERDDAPFPERALDAKPETLPRVAVIIPARDEAEGIAACIGSLFAQDYRGPFSIILVDDGSTDGTADIARTTAAEHLASFAVLARADAGVALEVVTGAPLPARWTGKLWAVK
jgi:cellulose synthase/poly-beta-1,6-N-acetylglucosamine synthase-like glycosyltransferase